MQTTGSYICYTGSLNLFTRNIGGVVLIRLLIATQLDRECHSKFGKAIKRRQKIRAST
jgi:hypothetical protein